MTTSNDIITLLKKMQPSMILDENTDLFDTGYIDSYTIFAELLPNLSEHYHFEMDPLDLMPENFSTPAAIAAFVNKKTEN